MPIKVNSPSSETRPVAGCISNLHSRENIRAGVTHVIMNSHLCNMDINVSAPIATFNHYGWVSCSSWPHTCHRSCCMCRHIFGVLEIAGEISLLLPSSHPNDCTVCLKALTVAGAVGNICHV